MTKNTNTITATVNPRKRIDTTIIIVLYAVLAIFSAIMGFYDLATDRNLFGVLFLIAAAIFSVLLLIKGNAVFGTYLKIRSDVLYMKSWANGFLPYDVNGGFLSDLKPSKTNIITVPADEISTILVGTKDFIKRNMTEAGRDFIKALYPYEHSSKKSKKNMISGLDMFYVETKDGKCAFMCIQDLSVKNVVEIMNEKYMVSPMVSIKVNNREYKRYVAKLNARENQEF